VSSQKSHHDTHLKSENHKNKSEIFKLKLDKRLKFKKKKIKKYGYCEVSKILDMMSGIEPKYELKLQKKSNKVIYELTKDELDENKEYDEFKSKFKNKLKGWHNLLSGAGVTGDPALDDIIHIIMLCYLDKNKDRFNLLKREYYVELDDEDFNNQSKLLKISELTKSQSNICGSGKNDGYSKIEMIGELLKLHPLTGKIIKENNFINCRKDRTIYDLIKDINNFCIQNNIFQYSDIIGIAYELWANEYKGSGGKELGNFFTERKLMKMCFEMIELNDINKMKINNNSTIGDEFCGTFGFPLYLKSFLKNKFNINIKNKNIYGIEFEDRASKMALLNAMFSLGNINNIKRGDSFVNNVYPHLDISVHNVPFGKRMKVKNIKGNYNDYKSNNLNMPDFNDIIPAEANKDAILASQMVIYKTSKIGLCIIKDGEEATGTNKSLVKYRKHVCDTVNVKKILKIPSGAFSSTGTKTLCLYFVKDGNKTKNIEFLELNEECNKIIKLCNIPYEDLEHNNYLWSPNTFMVDEQLEKMKSKTNCKWEKIGDICDFNRGERVTKKNHIENGEYFVIGGGNKSDNFKINNFNRSGFNCRIARYGGSEKNFIMKIDEKFWLHDNGFTIESKYIDNKFLAYYLINIIKNNYYYKKLYNGHPPAFAMNIFKNLQIPVPSIEIQKQTVENIELFDNMIKSVEIINKKHKEGMKIYINTMIKNNLDTIKWKKMNDVCEIRNGERITKKNIISGDYYVYGGGNETFTINKYNREGFTCKISRFGASRKNCVLILNKKYWLNDSGFTVNSKNTNILLNKYYFYYILNKLNNNKEMFEKLYHGGGQQNIKMDIFKNLEIPVPSINFQKEVIKYLDNINNIIDNNSNLFELYKENIKIILKQSYE
jgi:type I restriction enzyme S subunit